MLQSALAQESASVHVDVLTYSGDVCLSTPVFVPTSVLHRAHCFMSTSKDSTASSTNTEDPTNAVSVLRQTLRAFRHNLGQLAAALPDEVYYPATNAT